MSWTCEADAVHHRLSGDTKVVTSFTYECYDCYAPFNSLEELASHSVANPLHSQEMCLKCKSNVTIFYQLGETIRLHSCTKSGLCHLNPELFLHSRLLSDKLHISSTDPPRDSVISCDIQSCKATFEVSADGIFKFLKHVNKLKHSTLPNCRKCSLPDFQLTVQGVRIISHYCPKAGRLVCVTKS